MPIHPVDRHFGARIRLRRTLLGLSQSALGERIGGIAYQQVQKYENGRDRMSASRLWLAADALEVPVTFFFDNYPGDEAAASLPPDGRTDLDTLAMMRSFVGIKSRHHRQALVALARALGQSSNDE